MNLFKLKYYINQLHELEKKRNEIEENNSIDFVDKKINLSKIQETETSIMGYIKNGIPIKDSIFLNELILMISDFLGHLGCSKEDIMNSLSNVNFFTSDTTIGYGGLFVSFGNSIGIDLRFIDFDGMGNFKGFKREYYPFLKYTLSHELLHKCSIFKNHNKISMSDDALSEGFTDMLALTASNGYEYGSKNYEFFVKICSFFTSIVGMENIVDDYINNLGKWPNLKNLFYQCGLNDECFVKFTNELNQLLELTIMSNNQGDLLFLVMQKRFQVITFLRDNILSKISINFDKHVTLFDNLFSSYIQDYNSSNKHSK